MLNNLKLYLKIVVAITAPSLLLTLLQSFSLMNTPEFGAYGLGVGVFAGLIVGERHLIRRHKTEQGS